MCKRNFQKNYQTQIQLLSICESPSIINQDLRTAATTQPNPPSSFSSSMHPSPQPSSTSHKAVKNKKDAQRMSSGTKRTEEIDKQNFEGNSGIVKVKKLWCGT